MSEPMIRRAAAPLRSGNRMLPVCACGLVLALLTGCDYDPMERPHTWSLPPAGLTSNEENLRTMIVNPNDLVAGTGDDTSLGPMAAQPVTRLYTGHRAPLPASVGSVIPAASATGGQGGAGGPGPQ